MIFCVLRRRGEGGVVGMVVMRKKEGKILGGSRGVWYVGGLYGCLWCVGAYPRQGAEMPVVICLMYV